MKVNDMNLIAGVGAALESVLSIQTGWEGAFGTVIGITISLPAEAFDASVKDIIENTDEARRSKVDVVVADDKIEYAGVTLLRGKTKHIPMYKGLAAWIVEIDDANILRSAYPHTVEDGFVVPTDEEDPPELLEKLRGLNDRANSLQEESMPNSGRVALRLRACSLCRTSQETWPEIVAEARATLAGDMA